MATATGALRIQAFPWGKVSPQVTDEGRLDECNNKKPSSVFSQFPQGRQLRKSTFPQGKVFEGAHITLSFNQTKF